MKESQISREIQSFLRTIGFAVWSVEQGYRKEKGGTRQTPGIPDLIVIGHNHLLFVEVKNQKGQLRPSQRQFRDICQDNRVPWVMWRCVTEAFDWCVEQRIITPAQETTDDE